MKGASSSCYVQFFLLLLYFSCHCGRSKPYGFRVSLGALYLDRLIFLPTPYSSLLYFILVPFGAIDPAAVAAAR